MAVTLEALPPLEAIAALGRRGKKLDPTFSWQDAWEAEHASMFTVAKSAGFDILADIHEGLQRALGEGKTFRDFARELTPRLQEKGWWGRQIVSDPATGEERPAQLGSTRRLRTIFDTNMRVSYAAGHWESFERNKAARPFLRYVAILDERTRPLHRARHNLVLPVDHPYWDRWAPPCGWNCRCTLQSLSQRDVDRLKREGEDLRFEPPADTFRNFVNKRTGEVSRVPDGIDPGWAYNPGKAGHRASSALEKLIDAPPDLAAAWSGPDVADRIASEFKAWADAIATGERVDRGTFVVGVLDPSLLAAARARNVDPTSAAITVHQNQFTHAIRPAKKARGADVPADLLARLPELLAHPKAVLWDKQDPALIYVVDVPGDPRLGKLVVRFDVAGKLSAPDMKRAAIVSNAFRTASLVDRAALENTGTYELLSGEL